MVRVCKVLQYLESADVSSLQELVVMKNFAAFASKNLSGDVMDNVAKAVRLYVNELKELTQG